MREETTMLESTAVKWQTTHGQEARTKADVLHKAAHELRGALATFAMVANYLADDPQAGQTLADGLHSRIKQLDEMSNLLSALARQMERE